MSLSNCLALIPARTGSKSIPKKNFTLLAGMSPLERAFRTASEVTDRVVISTDLAPGSMVPWSGMDFPPMHWLERPAHLAQDDTPMLDVVTHALEAIPGPPEQIVLLVQPTQPLRQPKHLQAAVELLETSGADSVVSVTPIPLCHHPLWACEINQRGELNPWDDLWWGIPTRRQALKPAYARDGTVYAFRRATVAEYDSLYGLTTRAFIIPPSETCPLDSPEDWERAEELLSR